MSPAIEPLICSKLLVSTASPAAAAQPERVFTIIRLPEESTEVTVCLNIFTNLSVTGRSLELLTEYLYFHEGERVFISCKSFISREMVA